MTNTARETFYVEFHGSFWLVRCRGATITVKNSRHLTLLLSCKPLPDVPAPTAAPPPESIESYLARGGTITKVNTAEVERTRALLRNRPSLDFLLAEDF